METMASMLKARSCAVTELREMTLSSCNELLVS